MKHMRHWLMMVMLLCGITANAYDFEVDGIYYKITSSSDLTVEVTIRDYSENRYSGVVIIPSIVTYDKKTYRVTSIQGESFAECTGLTSITIPESVKDIGACAFDGCTGLTSITIPENSQLTSIGEAAFAGCCNLITTTIVPASVTSIGESAFYGCTGELIVKCNIPSASFDAYGVFSRSQFSKVTISDGITSIGSYAFYECSSLTSITIPESVKDIGAFAFLRCN